MKEIFFKGIAIAIPIGILFGLLYLFFHGLYSVYSDWQLKKELEQIRRESEARRARLAKEETSPEPDQADADEGHTSGQGAMPN